MLDEDVIVGGRYLMGRKIGSGSFGSILLGTDIETARFVAIKFVNIISVYLYRKNLLYLNIHNYYMKPRS